MYQKIKNYQNFKELHKKVLSPKFLKCTKNTIKYLKFKKVPNMKEKFRKCTYTKYQKFEKREKKTKKLSSNQENFFSLEISEKIFSLEIFKTIANIFKKYQKPNKVP